VAVVSLIIGLIALGFGNGAARWAGVAVGGMALVQAALGIQTVISVSPVGLSLLHQAGAAILWMAAVFCAYVVRR
jgi:heme A synthase